MNDAGGGDGPKPFAGPGGVDEHAGNARIVKAALCAGFYPSVLRVEHPPTKYKNVEGGAFAVRIPPWLYPCSLGAQIPASDGVTGPAHIILAPSLQCVPTFSSVVAPRCSIRTEVVVGLSWSG